MYAFEVFVRSVLLNVTSALQMDTSLTLNDNSQMLQTESANRQQMPEQLQPITEQAQQMTINSLENQLQSQLNNKVLSDLTQNTHMDEANAEVNALLGISLCQISDAHYHKVFDHWLLRSVFVCVCVYMCLLYKKT